MGDKVKKAIRQLLKLPENKFCADCPIKGPTWASINLGVFVCLECSGIHRHLGVHISQVRSTELDTWQKEWYLVMKKIGNEKANDYWEASMPEDYSGKPNQAEAQALSYKLKKFITDKYEKKLWVKKAGSKSTKKKKKQESSSSDSSSSSSDSSSSEEVTKTKKKKVPKKDELKKIEKKTDDHPDPELDLFGDFVSSQDVHQVTNQFAEVQVSQPKPGIDLSQLYGQGSSSGTTYGGNNNGQFQSVQQPAMMLQGSHQPPTMLQGSHQNPTMMMQGNHQSNMMMQGNHQSNMMMQGQSNNRTNQGMYNQNGIPAATGSGNQMSAQSIPYGGSNQQQFNQFQQPASNPGPSKSSPNDDPFNFF